MIKQPERKREAKKLKLCTTMWRMSEKATWRAGSRDALCFTMQILPHNWCTPSRAHTRMQASFSRNDTLSTNNFFGILCDWPEHQMITCAIFGRLLVTLTHVRIRTRKPKVVVVARLLCRHSIRGIIVIIIISIVTIVIDAGINVLPSDIAKHF